jgi:hypothetical protein
MKYGLVIYTNPHRTVGFVELNEDGSISTRTKPRWTGKWSGSKPVHKGHHEVADIYDPCEHGGAFPTSSYTAVDLTPRTADEASMACVLLREKYGYPRLLDLEAIRVALAELGPDILASAAEMRDFVIRHGGVTTISCRSGIPIETIKDWMSGRARPTSDQVERIENTD